MQDWQTFIAEQLRGGGAGNQILLSPLPPTGALRIGGRDAAAFLQGQASCDLRRIDPGRGGLGAFCNPQGRVIASFLIFHDGADYFLLLAADLVEPVARRLGMYVLRADVRIQVEHPALFGLSASEKLPGLPNEPLAVTSMAGLRWIRMPDPRPRWLAAGPCGAARKAWLEWAGRAQAGVRPAHCWQLEDIRCGISTVTLPVSEQFLPQMLNLDLLGAVSFHKGCYTGQEVIARTRYRGQVKRRLYRARVDAAPLLPVGSALAAGEESVGRVIHAAPSGSGQEILAVLRCDRRHGAAVHPPAHPDAPLRWLELAYTLA